MDTPEQLKTWYGFAGRCLEVKCSKEINLFCIQILDQPLEFVSVRKDSRVYRFNSTSNFRIASSSFLQLTPSALYLMGSGSLASSKTITKLNLDYIDSIREFEEEIYSAVREFNRFFNYPRDMSIPTFFGEG